MRKETGCELSIIVPCLNEESHLPYFLGSLQMQHINWVKGVYEPQPASELIVVDGGSRDDSLRVINRFRKLLGLRILIVLDETRNLGFIRNKGALAARGKVLLFTNADAILPFCFLDALISRFADPQLAALSGATIPLDGGAVCSVAYRAFDLLRWAFSKIGRFSPSGNFLAVRASVLRAVGGFRELRINEDGELGIRISQYAKDRGMKVQFDLNLAAAHFSERFREGALKTLMFYAYVFGNFSPILRKILRPVEKKSSRRF